MIPLEQRYRKMLRWLPTSYRRRWEDNMVAAFLESMHTDDPEDADYIAHCGKPSRAEKASILRLAIRLRLGGAGTGPREFAWGQAVRLVALIGLTANTVMAMGGVWHVLWETGQVPWPPVPLLVGGSSLATHTPWDTTLLLLGLSWGAALVAILYGRRRQAMVFSTLALTPTVYGLVVNTVIAFGSGLYAFLPTQYVGALVTAVPMAALAAFHSDAPPMRRGSWLLALGTTPALAAVVEFLPWAPGIGSYLLDARGVWSVALIGAAVLHLARGHADASPWTLALALLVPVVLGVQVLSLSITVAFTDFMTRAGATRLLVGGIAQCVALAVLGIVLLVRAGRTLRRLPDEPQASRPAVAP